jgi:hypothetical protein
MYSPGRPPIFDPLPVWAPLKVSLSMLFLRSETSSSRISSYEDYSRSVRNISNPFVFPGISKAFLSLDWVRLPDHMTHLSASCRVMDRER